MICEKARGPSGLHQRDSRLEPRSIQELGNAVLCSAGCATTDATHSFMKQVACRWLCLHVTLRPESQAGTLDGVLKAWKRSIRFAGTGLQTSAAWTVVFSASAITAGLSQDAGLTVDFSIHQRGRPPTLVDLLFPLHYHGTQGSIAVQIGETTPLAGTRTSPSFIQQSEVKRGGEGGGLERTHGEVKIGRTDESVQHVHIERREGAKGQRGR